MRKLKPIIWLIWLLSLVGSNLWAQEPASNVIPLDVILLIDSSPSTDQTDPNHLRINATSFLLDYLEAVSQVLGVNYRAGFANFGGTLGETMPLRPLQEGAVAKALQVQRIPFTDFRPPLDFALKEFRARSFGTGNKMIVVLFTDGNPQLTEKSLSAEDKRRYFKGESIEGDKSPDRLDRLISELQNAGVVVFVVAVGDARQDAQLWQSLISNDHYRPINSTSNLADVFHNFIADQVGNTVSLIKILKAGQRLPVSLDPYLEQVVFCFIKDRVEAKVKVIDPLGNTLRPTVGGRPEDFHEIYSIADPLWDRPWQMQVKGGGAQMWVDYRLPSLTFEAPPSPQALGIPVKLRATLLRRQKVISDQNLQLEARVEAPSAKQFRDLPLQGSTGGQYELILKDITKPGTYVVTLKALWNGRSLQANAPLANISFFPVPAIEDFSVKDEVTAGDSIKLTARIRYADHFMPDTPVITRLFDRRRREVQQFELRQDTSPPDAKAEDRFYAGQARAPQDSGNYILEFSVLGQTKDGLHFNLRERTRCKVVAAAAPPVTNSYALTRLTWNYSVILWPAAFFLSMIGAILLVRRKIRLMSKSEEDLRYESVGWQSQYDEVKRNYDKEKNEWESKIKELEKENKDLRNQLEPLLRAKKLWQQALDLAKDNKPDAAKKKFSEAFDAILEYSQKADKTASQEVEKILNDMLKELYNGKLDEQRTLIYAQANDKAPPVQINGLARVLLERWVFQPENMLEEFYALRCRPKGDELMNELRYMRLPDEWEGEQVRRSVPVLRMAQAAYQLAKEIGGGA